MEPKKEINNGDNLKSSTVQVELRIFANLRQFTDFKKKIFRVKKGTKIGDFLKEIAPSLPQGDEFLEEVIDQLTTPPILRKYVKIILNGRILFTKKALYTPINQDNSVVAIFPPIGGG